MNRKLFRLIVILVIAAVLASACGSSTSASSGTTDTEQVEAETIAVASPAQTQLDWIVGALNDPNLLTVEAIEEHFSPTFLSQVTPEQIVQGTAGLDSLALRPYSVEQFDVNDAGLAGQAVLLGTDGGRLNVQIQVGPVAPNLIDGLLLTPTEIEFPEIGSIDELDVALATAGPQSSLGIYQITDGECSAVHELRTDEQIVLGSIFKLWVLAALAHEIDEGRAAWDETVAVTDELRSNPSGEIYNLETGTEVTLQRLAEVMISISDNTATDLLIDRLGRQTIEEAIARSGVADPSANIPLLSTGNLFTLKFAAQEPNVDDYRELDVAGRRELLETIDASVSPWLGLDITELSQVTNVDGLPQTQPRDLDLEWFATAEDLCRTLIHLGDLANVPGLEPVATALELNPGEGLPFDRQRWTTIRFKAGSEPGVLAGAWWFEDVDGDQFVIAGGVTNPDEPLSELTAITTLAGAIQLVE